jgi:fumarate hydratase class I
LAELIRRTSSDLPSDVERALRRAARIEKPGSAARWALDEILRNTILARQRGAPLCQDTGTLNFLIATPLRFDARALLSAIPQAVRLATDKGWLRQNTIASVSGAPCPHNLGLGAPVVHLEPERRATVAVRLLLKGGGSENMSRQYSLPDAALGAGRDLEGVRRCILDAAWRAQGNGCAPGILGVCVGGDRASGADHAKRQLLRLLGHDSSVPELARLERRVLREVNSLGIGPMGLGGRTTLLGVHIGTLARLPASFFVSVAYMCWACRRRGFTARPDGRGLKWVEG